jgi:hypothetical protein
VAAVRHPDMRTNVPIKRSFVNVDALSDLHQWGCKQEFQELFPQFCEGTYLERQQMILTMWYLRYRDTERVDLRIWIYMLFLGGRILRPSGGPIRQVRVHRPTHRLCPLIAQVGVPHHTPPPTPRPAH